MFIKSVNLTLTSSSRTTLKSLTLPPLTSVLKKKRIKINYDGSALVRAATKAARSIINNEAPLQCSGRSAQRVAEYIIRAIKS